MLYWMKFRGEKFSRLKPFREIFRFRGNLFSRMWQFHKILRELIFVNTDIGKKGKRKKIFLFKKICWNDYVAKLLVLENKIISIIKIIY